MKTSPPRCPAAQASGRPASAGAGRESVRVHKITAARQRQVGDVDLGQSRHAARPEGPACGCVSRMAYSSGDGTSARTVPCSARLVGRQQIGKARQRGARQAEGHAGHGRPDPQGRGAAIRAVVGVVADDQRRADGAHDLAPPVEVALHDRGVGEAADCSQPTPAQHAGLWRMRDCGQRWVPLLDAVADLGQHIGMIQPRDIGPAAETAAPAPLPRFARSGDMAAAGRRLPLQSRIGGCWAVVDVHPGNLFKGYLAGARQACQISRGIRRSGQPRLFSAMSLECRSKLSRRRPPAKVILVARRRCVHATDTEGRSRSARHQGRPPHPARCRRRRPGIPAPALPRQLWLWNM